VPALVILCGLFIAKLILEASAYYIVVATVAVVLGLVLVRNLQFGVLLYFFLAALAFGESPAIQSPHSGYKAGLMPSQVFLGFLALLWLIRAAFFERSKIVRSELNLPLVVLAVVSIASLATNNILRGSRELLFHQMLITQIAEVGLMCFSICAFFLAANTLKDRKWVRAIFAPVVLLGLYFAAHRIARFDFPIPMIWGSFLLAAAIAFVYSKLLFENLDRGRSISLGLLLAVMLFAAYKDLSWVSGWLAVTGVILVVSYHRSKAMALVLFALILIVLLVNPGIYHSIHEESSLGGDFDRFVIWQDAFKMFMKINPILGVGPGNYHPFVYWHNTLWFGGRTYTTAHSNYAQMGAELGLVGLAVFLWVIVSGIRAGRRASRTAPSDTRWLPIAATSIFAAMAVASLFGDYLFPSRGNNGIVTFGTTVYTWLIMGAAVAAANLRDDQSE
jgi:hypothetical protein